MKRRDFIKFLSAGAATAALPVALTSPALGKYHRSASGEISEWKDFYAADFLRGPELNQSELADARKGALEAFRRRMEADGYTEIRGFTEELSYDLTYRGWMYIPYCQLR